MIYHGSWIFSHDFPTIFTIDFNPTPAVHVGVPQLRGAAGDVVGLETFQVFFLSRDRRGNSDQHHGKTKGKSGKKWKSKYLLVMKSDEDMGENHYKFYEWRFSSLGINKVK